MQEKQPNEARAKKIKVLIADDIEINRVILAEIFDDTYEIHQAENGKQAIEIIQRMNGEIDLILLDILMPEMNGYEVLNWIRSNGLSDRIPVVVVTVIDNLDNEICALELGASDILLKPIEPALARKRIQNIWEAFRYRKMTGEEGTVTLCEANKEYENLSNVLEEVLTHPNVEPADHMLRVSGYTEAILNAYGRLYPEAGLDAQTAEVMGDAALLHDIGKTAISEVIIRKEGLLSERDQVLFNVHCAAGSKIVELFSSSPSKQFLQYAYNMCKYHHERMDGTGFPDGVEDEAIPFYAQAVSAANEYDKLLMRGSTPEEAGRSIQAKEGSWYKSSIVKSFCEALPELERIQRQITEYPMQECSDRVSEILRKEILGSRQQNERPRLHSLYALFRYLEATVIEVDVENESYSRVYSTLADFTDLPGRGGMKEVLQPYLKKHVRNEFYESMLKRLKENLREEAGNGLGETYPIYNDLYGEYQWYHVSCITMDIFYGGNRKLFVLKNLSNDISAQNAIEKTKEEVSNITSVINKYKQENEYLRVLAKLDQLTGLYNKITAQSLIESKRRAFMGKKHGLLIFDLDNFKSINDTRGHLTGDRVLQNVGAVLKGKFRDEDVIGRIGGDEFIAFLANISGEEVLVRKANSILDSLKNMNTDYMDGEKVTASIGGVLCNDREPFEALFRKADSALYKAKRLGRGTFQLYSDSFGVKKARTAGRGDVADSSLDKKTEEEFNKTFANVLFEPGDRERLVERVMDKLARFYRLDRVMVTRTDGGEAVYWWFADQKAAGGEADGKAPGTKKLALHDGLEVLFVKKDVEQAFTDNEKEACAKAARLLSLLIQNIEK